MSHKLSTHTIYNNIWCTRYFKLTLSLLFLVILNCLFLLHFLKQSFIRIVICHFFLQPADSSFKLFRFIIKAPLIYLVCLFVGIHALINMHEYYCIVIRIRCQLLDNSYYSFSNTVSVIHTRLAQITCYIHVIYGINIFRHQSNSKRETNSCYSHYSQHIRNNQLFRP